MTKQFENGSRNGSIRTNAYGEFVTFIGYRDGDYNTGMQVVDCKTYKSEKAAMKFINKWFAA